MPAASSPAISSVHVEDADEHDLFGVPGGWRRLSGADMTDFASLLAADRGQKARPIHLVDKKRLRRLAQEAAGRGPRLLEAQRFDGKTAFASCCCRAAATSRW